MTRREQERHDVERSLPPELALLLNAIRQEFNAKLGQLKLWGALALFGGATCGGIVARLVPGGPPDPAAAAVRVVSSLLP